MTLKEYIENPMGKGDSVVPAVVREAQRNEYVAKFNNVLLRENGNIDYRCYYDDKANTYWLHVKVPSEHVEKFYYDVLFKFSANAEKGTENNLFNWDVQFYSNDPAFVYTYVYAFNQRDLFIKELSSKMSKSALNTPSKEKNPSGLVGYCKIIYFAYIIMEEQNLNKINMFKTHLLPFSPRNIVKSIDHADDKIEARQSQTEIKIKKKKTISEDEYRRIKKIAGGDIEGVTVRVTSKVPKIKKINNVKSVGKVNKIKRGK